MKCTNEIEEITMMNANFDTKEKKYSITKEEERMPVTLDTFLG
jgi:hypothetical protein